MQARLKMKNLITISLLLIVSNATTYWFSSDVSAIFAQPEVPIIAEIQLEPNCELMTKSFIVVDLLTKKSASFNLSKAYLKTVEGNPLQVQMNPKFSGVVTDFKPHNAKKAMKIELDCNMSNRLKNTLDSLRNTFSN